MRLLTVIVACGAILQSANAHEVNPAYLEIRETTPGHHDVIWKQPVKDGKRLKIDPIFPETCDKQHARFSQAPGIIIEHWKTVCDLTTGSLTIAGLDRTLTDTFVRINRLDAAPISIVLRAGKTSIDLTTAKGASPLTYIWLGAEHILLGFDHLLFVIGLFLLVRPKQLFSTITAFTIAHSITLALSTLAGITLAGPPVEIVIALSIVLLARESIYKKALTTRHLWLLTFGFGLIHGFGFAGALSQIGLPPGAEALALGLFNIGVEIGQLCFLAALITLTWLISSRLMRQQALKTVLSYTIGIAGTYWVIERVEVIISYGA